ncbi:MAG TPA: tetratricopeptide repeat protein [Pyrinomonadaceae bacterium]|nr:tetratricopeptide repeat protein [Pyrinomonadaceae bacterium]
MSLDIPKGWQQFVAGAPVEGMTVGCTVKVIGLVIELTGKTKQHDLIDPVENIVKKTRLDVSFDMPKLGRSLPLRVFESEQVLKKFLKRRSAVRITSRIRLPRIRCGDVYWPLSERVGKLLVSAANDSDADRLAFAGVEGTDLSSIWEKRWDGLFRLGPPVLATASDGNLVDVRLLMETEQFDAVIALQSEFEKHPSEEFAHLLAWAYYLQGLALFEKSESSSDDKINRLLRLAVEKFQSAIRLKPKFPEAHKTLGKSLRDLGEFEEAVCSYDRAVALNPTDFEAWADRAAPLINQAKLDQAIESSTNAVQHGVDAPSRAYALAMRAAAYHFANQPTEAISDLTDAWKAHPPTIVDSLPTYALYEQICGTEPSAEAILLLAELRWTEAAHHSANNEVDEANKWNELAYQTLELLSPKESGDVVLSGSLSNQLIDEVLIRTAARFGSNRALQKAIVTRMQMWITSARGEELAALNSALSEQ